MVLTANYRFITAPREQIREAAKKMRDGDKKRMKRSLLIDRCDADKTKRQKKRVK